VLGAQVPTTLLFKKLDEDLFDEEYTRLAK
jgi:hypothetical protein